MADKITIKTPGKLMVAGEFAVLEPYQKLIVTAVNRFVYTTIKTNDVNEVNVMDFNMKHLNWSWKGNSIVFDNDYNKLRFVKSAMQITYQYLKDRNIAIYPVSLSVKSELADASGVKYGLGSSAAVVTSVVKAILSKFLPAQPPEDVIFKLAAIAHVTTQRNGSGADIAASTYGGVLEYTSFQAEWLLKEIETSSNITTLIEKKWTYLSIHPISFPTTINMLVAWTGKAASTKKLVEQIKLLKKRNPEAYETFLQKSADAVKTIIKGMHGNDKDIFFSGIKQNRLALSELGEAANVEIETDKLYIMSKVAEQAGGAGKLSGAGGGDCGLVFLPFDQSLKTLKDTFSGKGIQILDLMSYQFKKD